MASLLVFGVVVIALALFVTERVPIHVTSLLVLCLLTLSGVLTPSEAFAGFSDPTVVFIFSLLAMTQGLASTGVLQILAERTAALSRFGPRAFVLSMMAVVAAFSTFMSNTVTTAAFLPVATGLAARARVPKRQLLLPLAYASMLGGTVLLFGTSTNLVMSSAMRQAGLGGLGVTELAPVALPLVLLGFAYLFWAGPRFLQGPGSGPEAAHGSTRAYLTEMCPGPRSRWLGQAPEALTRAVGVRAVGVIPASGQRGAGGIVPGDRLVVEAVREVIVGLLNQTDLGIGPGVDASEVDEPANSVLVEALIPLGSPLVGRSLREMRVPQRHGLATIALHRRPGLQRLMKLQLFGRVRGNPSLSDLPLSAGDVLLLRGAREHVARLDDGSTLLVLSDVKLTPPRYRKALTALFIFGAALAVATLGLLPLPIAGLSGLLAMVATGCVDPRAAFRIDWPVLVMIASMMALGLAMEKSGAARIMGERLAHLGSVAGPRGVLFALLLLTSTLSIPMSNQAAALVVFPIALSAAAQLGVDPRPLAIGVTLAASYSFATPLEPSCVLVYGAGHYRFSDFLRMGAPLTAGLLLALTWAVPTFWPF